MDQRELEAHLEGRADIADLNGDEAQTPVEEASQETPAVAETVSEPEQAQPDPVQDYLAKYNGDTDAALKAAAEAQSLIGRQGQELGELRAMREEMQALRQALDPSQQPVQYEAPTEEQWNWADEIGMSDNWQQGAEWALQNQPHLYDRIINAAATINPVAVNRYETTMALRAQQQQQLQQMQPLFQRQLSDQFGLAYNQVRQNAPDLEQLTPQFLQAAEQFPEMLQTLQTGTPEAKQRVIQGLYWIAKGQNAAPLADAASQAAQDAANESAAARLQAAVGTTTNSAPAPTPGETDHLSSWRSDLREELGLPPLEAA